MQSLPASGLFLGRTVWQPAAWWPLPLARYLANYGVMLPQANLQHVMFAHFLYWPVDLRIEIQRWPDGRLIESGPE